MDKQELLLKIRQAKKVKAGRLYLRSLFEFNRQVLHVEDGGVALAPFHRQMCEMVEKPFKKELLLLPRAHLKSTLITIGYSLLRIAENPSVRILIGNATYDMATSFLTQIKKHIQYNETFKYYYGDLFTNADKWSENMITIPKKNPFQKKEATVTAYGMGGNLVSQHYDLIIGDDLVNRDFITSKEQIEKTILFYKDALDLLEPTGKFIIIGTRWADGDLYGWIMDKTNPEEIYKDFEIMIKRAYEGNLDTGENLSILFPQKFTPQHLKDLKRNKGPIEFSSQYMNEPLPQESAKFKMDWIKGVLEDELRVRELNYFTTVDPAIGQKKDSDNSAIVTIAVDQWNNWFVVNIVKGHMLPNEIIKNIFWNNDAYHPRRIGIELTAYQKSLQYALVDEMRRRNIFLPIVELKAERSKEERILGLVPRYANGTIFHLTQCPFREELEEELVRFPIGKHDDLIDALAYQLQIAHQARNPVKGTHSRDTWEREDRRPSRYLY